MELIWATEDLVIGGRPRQGLPILLWDSMESCQEANQFFTDYLLRGAIGSKRTWRVVGEALYDYFSFLQAHELAWDAVRRGDDKSLVTGYRDYCFEVAEHADNTVRLRLFYVCQFYEFAQAQGWIKHLPFRKNERTVAREHGGFLAHVDAAGSTAAVNSVMPKKHKNLPKFLSKGQIKALLAAATNPHHQLLIRLSLQTGLRLEEMATFPLSYVFEPDKAGRTERNIRVTLDPNDGHGMQTKGSKKRDIYIGRRFMKELHHYAVHLRGERSSLCSTPHKPLFLNQSGEPYGADGKGIGALVRKLGERAGVDVHTHMLRHSYATHTLVALQRNRDQHRIEPLVFLQRQLGHASIQTTMIYLHLINEIVDDAVLAYDDELNEWVND